MIVGVVIVFVGGYFVIEKYSEDLPEHEILAKYEPAVMTRIHASDGRLISEYAKERRMFLPIQMMPPVLKQAFLSAEDKNFYKHTGLDFTGIARALVVNVENKVAGNNRRLVGASTITQQVAKNFLLTSERNFDRKIKEAILAYRIESTFSKDQILELYLNEIFLGLRSYGVAAAALNYFGKAIYEITPAEAAYLAALPKAPSNYHPFRQTERAIERRNWVLDRMVVNGYLDADQAKIEKARPLNVKPRDYTVRLQAAGYFVEEVRRELGNLYGDDKLYTGGLSVRTTLDPEMQVMARKALASQLTDYDQKTGWRGPVKNVPFDGDWAQSFKDIKLADDVDPWVSAIVIGVNKDQATIGLKPRSLPNGSFEDKRITGSIDLKELSWAVWSEGDAKGKKIRSADQVLAVGDVIYVEKLEEAESGYTLRQIPEVSGAIVAMDPHTGRVHALVGGFSYDISEFNRATQAFRQPGSSFKPFVYSAALDNGYTPSNVVLDAPIEIEVGDEIWKPANYTKKFYGPSTLRIGIEQSRNVMTVRLAQLIGMPTISEYSRLFGIYDNLSPVLAMSLGSGETTVLRMTTAYSMLANGGRQIKPTLIDRVQDRRGRTIYRHDERRCDSCSAQEWNEQVEPEIIDERRQILDPHTAYQMTSMMQGVLRRGTASRVGKLLGRPAAGKTGTTNDYRDAWFVGYTPNLVVGVYIGFDKPKNMGRSATGGGLAAPVFEKFVSAALADQPPTPFPVPAGVTLYRIDAKTGMRADESGTNVILEPFKPGTAPPENINIIKEDFFNQSSDALSSGTGGLY